MTGAESLASTGLRGRAVVVPDVLRAAVAPPRLRPVPHPLALVEANEVLMMASRDPGDRVRWRAAQRALQVAEAARTTTQARAAAISP